MPALVAGIHVLRANDHQSVDGRDKPGHDDAKESNVSYFTPSFFCRLVEDVVYWNTSFLSG